MFGGCSETEITDMSFDGKLFSVTGKDYDCSINREFAGLRAEDGWFVVEAIGVYGCVPIQKEKITMMQPTVLGTVPDEGMGRDAIHIAVLPARAQARLYPGQFVQIGKGNGEYVVGPANTGHGIIDPFLKHAVTDGDLVWVLLLPGTVQDMRHHWSHPEIDALAENVTEGKLSEGAARRYLLGVAASIHVGIEAVLEAGDAVESKGEDYFMPGRNRHAPP